MEAVNTEIQALAASMPTAYLRAFFAEKEIPEVTFQVADSRGETHIMPNTIVVEHIARVSRTEADKIASVLRKIDFANGDVNHFLQHLARALVG